MRSTTNHVYKKHREELKRSVGGKVALILIQYLYVFERFSEILGSNESRYLSTNFSKFCYFDTVNNTGLSVFRLVTRKRDSYTYRTVVDY